jgi:hypothetical protein
MSLVSSIGKTLLNVAKPIVVARLKSMAEDITPEEIEAKLNIDGFIEKIESNEKFKALEPLFEAWEKEGTDIESALAILIDALLDLIPELVDSIKIE